MDQLGRALMAQSEQAAQLQVMRPINDVQIVALVASNLKEGTAEERVDMAVEIVARALVAVKGGMMQRFVKKLQPQEDNGSS